MQEELTRWLIVYGDKEVPANFLLSGTYVPDFEPKWVLEATYFKYLARTNGGSKLEKYDEGTLRLSKKGLRVIKLNGGSNHDRINSTC
jgi:hypothetical protein